MEVKAISTSKLGLELKYCERCGGLWLRPVGGEQIYCVACGRAMAELPPASYEIRHAKVPRGPRCAEVNGPEDAEGIGRHVAGGVA
jgi:Zn-finger nucleic acid-binding protein